MTQPSISLLKHWLGYLAAFVSSSVPVFCCVCIHAKSTGLVPTTLGNGRLRKHLRKSGSSLMSRPIELKLRTTGALRGRHENVLEMAFFLTG